jgi:hypothetical protein
VTHAAERAALAALLASLLLVACSPLAPPFRGDVAPVRLPATRLAPEHLKTVFAFVYHDADVTLKGDGVARTAAPDSLRFDWFVNNEAVGSAIVIGDSLLVAQPRMTRRLLPPLPFVWAALGVLRTPSAADTLARVDSDTLRIEIAGDPAWRATFMGPELLRLDLLKNGRIPQTVRRVPGASVHYESPRNGRTLDLTVSRVDTVTAFDAAIWR